MRLGAAGVCARAPGGAVFSLTPWLPRGMPGARPCRAHAVVTGDVVWSSCSCSTDVL